MHVAMNLWLQLEISRSVEFLTNLLFTFLATLNSNDRRVRRHFVGFPSFLNLRIRISLGFIVFPEFGLSVSEVTEEINEFVPEMKVLVWRCWCVVR
jgi:putative flippase GtrA